jgi:hypothetical protein
MCPLLFAPRNKFDGENSVGISKETMRNTRAYSLKFPAIRFPLRVASYPAKQAIYADVVCVIFTPGKICRILMSCRNCVT